MFVRVAVYAMQCFGERADADVIDRRVHSGKWAGAGGKRANDGMGRFVWWVMSDGGEWGLGTMLGLEG